MDLQRSDLFVLRASKRSTRYFVVHVAATHGDLQDVMNRLGIAVGRNRIASCVAASADGPKWRGLVGFLFFSKDALGSGIVAHEIAHAGFRVMEHAGIRIEHWRNLADESSASTDRYAHRAEERYCNVVEHMTRSFWIEVYKRGLAS